MEDPKKVQAKVAQLNSSYPPAKWNSVTGFQSTNVASFGKPGKSVGQAADVVFKAFLNTETSEIKMFDFKAFIQRPGGRARKK